MPKTASNKRNRPKYIVDKKINKSDVEEVSRSKQVLSSQYWRLNNLYYIIDKNNRKVLFRMNKSQKKFYEEMHYWNIILKARQLGFSTLIDLIALDTALFNDNISVMIIADVLDNAEKIFKTKVKYPYDNLPDSIREARKAKLDSARHLQFSNNSDISVGISGRTSTIGVLHLSEYSKVCVEHPDRAKEIKLGSFPAVHPGNLLFIESTARGASGDFYDLCKESQDLCDRGVALNKRQFKFHFFPWHESETNRLESDSAIIEPWLKDYFADLAVKHDIFLDKEQQAWYATEYSYYGSDIRSEHPSYPEEAFHVPLEGAYYAVQFRKMRQDSPTRITKVPYMPGYLVDTAWDIGVGDSTAIWFVQVVGRELHFIDYYENHGEGVQHYINILHDKSEAGNWRYGRHIAPHDITHREFGNNADTILQTARRLGIKFEVADNLKVEDGIEAVRQMLDISWFDEEKCADGVAKLEGYRKEWDNQKGMWKNRPLHNHCSHASDSARYYAISWKKEYHKRIIRVIPKEVSAVGWT